MARPEPVQPVKLIAAVLWADREALQAALELMQEQWGEIDLAGADHLFDVTDYYREQMGPALQRRLISFEKLISPERLAEIKHLSNDLEDRLRRGEIRPVNIDTGYLDHCKLVLGSFKFAGQKIYLRDGVWADLICRWKKGRFEYFPWSFPDFRTGRYDRELEKIRGLYLRQQRTGRNR